MAVIPTQNILSLKRQPMGDSWFYTFKVILPGINSHINLPGLPNIIAADMTSSVGANTGLSVILNQQGATLFIGALTLSFVAGGDDQLVYGTAVGR